MSIPVRPSAPSGPLTRVALPSLAPLVRDCVDLLEQPASAAIVDGTALADLAKWVDAARVGIDVLIESELGADSADALASWLRLSPAQLDDLRQSDERVPLVLADGTVIEMHVGDADRPAPLFAGMMDAPLLVFVAAQGELSRSAELLAHGRSAVMVIGPAGAAEARGGGHPGSRSPVLFISWGELSANSGPVRSIDAARALTRLRAVRFLASSLTGIVGELEAEVLRSGTLIGELRTNVARLSAETLRRKQAAATASRILDEVEADLGEYVAQQSDELLDLECPGSAERQYALSRLDALSALRIHRQPFDVDMVALPEDFRREFAGGLRNAALGRLQSIGAETERRLRKGLSTANEVLTRAGLEEVAATEALRLDHAANRVTRRIHLDPVHGDFEASIPKVAAGALTFFRTQVFLVMGLLGVIPLIFGDRLPPPRSWMNGQHLFLQIGAGLALAAYTVHQARRRREKAQLQALKDARVWVLRESKRVLDEVRKAGAAEIGTIVADAFKRAHVRVDAAVTADDARARDDIKRHDERRAAIESTVKEISGVIAKLQERRRKLEEPERALQMLVEEHTR